MAACLFLQLFNFYTKTSSELIGLGGIRRKVASFLQPRQLLPSIFPADRQCFCDLGLFIDFFFKSLVLLILSKKLFNIVEVVDEVGDLRNGLSYDGFFQHCNASYVLLLHHELGVAAAHCFADLLSLHDP